MKTLIIGILLLVVGCEESPERQLARRQLADLKRQDALKLLERSVSGGVIPGLRAVAKSPTQLEQEKEAAWKAAEDAGCSTEEIAEALGSGYRKAAAK